MFSPFSPRLLFFRSPVLPCTFAPFFLLVLFPFLAFTLSPPLPSSSAFVPFYFIHYSDPQIGRSAEGEPNLDSAVAQIGRMRPVPGFIYVAGDMADNPLDSAIVHDQWTRCRTRFNRLSMPKYFVAGNNDVGYPSELQSVPRMITWFCNFWGPDYYSVDLDSCHFIVLNSTLLNCFSGHVHYPTALQQDSFLRWDLQQNIQTKTYRHLFFIWHFPPYNSDPFEGNSTGNVNRPRRDTLLADLVKYNFTAVFSGHTHSDLQNLYGPSLLQTGLATCTGPLTSTGYRIVKVFHSGIETFTVLLSSPLDTLPLANIVSVTATPETVQVNQPVTFRAVPDTVNYPAWSGLTYRWLFGDGDSSRSATTVHAFRDTGRYRVVFTGTKGPSIGSLYYFNLAVLPQQSIAEEKTVSLTGLNLRIATIQKGSISFEAANSGTVPQACPPKAEGLSLLSGADANDLNVIISVYDVHGRQVIKPLSLTSGTHHVRFSENLPSGIYFIRLTTSSGSVLKKVILLH